MTSLEAWFAAWQETERTPERVDEWVDRTAKAVEAEVPEVCGDLEPVVRSAVSEHWLAFLDHVAGAGPLALPAAARAFALEIAQRHLGLPILVKVYRAAQRSSWTYVTDLVADTPEEVDREGLLVVLWGQAAEWFDAAVEESIILHQQETRRIEQRGDARRYGVVAGLLAGEESDTPAVSAALGGHPLGGSHIALIARAMTPDSAGSLDSALIRLVAGTGLHRPLFVRPGGREVWCWAPAEDLPTSWEKLPDPAAVRVTVGGPAEGLDGFVLAHHEARTAQSVALETRRPQPVTAYADVVALTFLALDHEAARRFIARTLGGLADEGTEHLRETVRAYLTGSGGTEAVASTLMIHKNTVRYRITQAERLLGRPVRERAGDLLLALDYVDVFM